MRLHGRVAIVTGASRGIGKGIAKVYADEGASVLVVARTEEAGRLPGTIHETVMEIREAGGNALAVRCDVTDDEQVRAMVKATMDTYGRRAPVRAEDPGGVYADAGTSRVLDAQYPPDGGMALKGSSGVHFSGQGGTSCSPGRDAQCPRATGTQR